MLETILNGNIKLIDQFDIEQPAYLEEEVVIVPNQVRKMLTLYLNKTISSFDLKKWANFVCLRAEYVVPGGTDDVINDHYEDMFYVIQRLSTPEIDGEINEERVKAYLKELDKYGHE